MEIEVAIFMLYGVPEDPMSDQSYYNYFLRGIRLLPHETHIYVAGGATDPSRPDMTEAETAKDALVNRLGIAETRIHAHPQGLDAREALEALADAIPCDDRHLIVFCAWTHQELVVYHVRRLFGFRAEVIPLSFPADLQSGSIAAWSVRIMRIPRTLLGILGMKYVWARRLEMRLRRRHMERVAERRRD